MVLSNIKHPRVSSPMKPPPIWISAHMMFVASVDGFSDPVRLGRRVEAGSAALVDAARAARPAATHSGDRWPPWPWYCEGLRLLCWLRLGCG